MTSSQTTAPGSTTTGGSASSSPNSKPSASPSPKPTPAGTASRTARHTHGRYRPAALEPERGPPHNVGSARLTCGQPASSEPSTQVSPKREHLAFQQVRDIFRS